MQMNIVIYILTKSCEYASVFLICNPSGNKFMYSENANAEKT